MRHLSIYAWSLIFGWITILTANNAIGRLEGQYMPVVEGFIIEQSGETVSGHYDKIRNCTLISSTWYYADGDEMIPVDIQRTGFAKIRSTGRYYYGPWKVSIEPEELKERSYVLVTHSCHPIWNTITRVYPQ